MRSYGFSELMSVYRRVRRLLVIAIVLFVVSGMGITLKNIVLNQIKKEIQDKFGYTRLYLNLFPPSLILEDARSVSVSPFFSAKKVAIGISYRSLFSREKPVTVIVESPVLRVSRATRSEGEPGDFRLIFPFTVDKVLLRDGELYFWGSEVRFQAGGINAHLSQKGDRYTMNAEVETYELALGQLQNEIQGRLSLALEGQGDSIHIQKARISSPQGILRAEGTLVNPSDPEIQINTSYNVQIDLIAKLLDLPFDYEGQAQGKGVLLRENGGVRFTGSLSSDTLVFNQTHMGRVNGDLDFSQSAGGLLDLNIQRKNFPGGHLRLRFHDDKVEGTVRAVHLDPIMKYIKVPWPVLSPVWGTFSVINERITAKAEFRDDVEDGTGKEFLFRGNMDLTFDKGKVSLFSEDLDSNFAKVRVQGQIDIENNVDVSIEGDVKDVRKTREFVSLLLQKNFEFPEIRGSGRARVRIFEDYDFPRIEGTVSISPGGFDTFDAESVTGAIEINEKTFYGRFRVQDPAMKGRINVVSTPDETKADIQLDEGLAETLLPKLDILLPLAGTASGNFKVTQRGIAVQVEGDFSSPQMTFLSQIISRVSGKFTWEENALFFSELRFGLYEGQIRGRALLKLLSQKFDLDVNGDDLNLSVVNPQLQGMLSFNIKGSGDFGSDAAMGPFFIRDLHMEPFQKTESQGEAKLSFTPERLDLRLEGNFLPGENRFSVSLGIPIIEESIEGKINGSFTNPDLLLPWTGAKGEVHYLADLSGTKQSPRIKGAIDAQGSVLPFPQFAHAFRDFSALVFFENGDFSIRSFQGKMGEGDVQGSGTLKIGLKGIEKIDVVAEGKDMHLALIERTRALADGTVNLLRDENRFDLIGNFYVHQALWQRELEEKFAFSSSSLFTPRREPSYFDDLNLNIRLHGDGNAWMENSLGRVRGRFDLSINGRILDPIITGDIELVEGEVYFQDREFKVLSGKVSFFNPAKIEPFISFKGETYVKDFRVTFSLNGFLESLNPELSSSPPLPPEDVLALLAMGEAFKRTYQYDRSTQIGTASLVSFQLSEPAQKSAENLFSIDRFRIDPFMMGASSAVTARLTVGKKISRNIFFLYSTNLTAQRDDITRIEWELTNDISIVGTRDEEGRVSLDVKIHKRF
ncbi:MAG: translocation/assembly module TamB domain-containing protein [Candidatus Aminicenantes bacterium]|nr:translocation/assembly module TamB domain-containing protein [Candidatus Aminicenantes bacterium]